MIGVAASQKSCSGSSLNPAAGSRTTKADHMNHTQNETVSAKG
jgi:hypothetical protein